MTCKNARRSLVSTQDVVVDDDDGNKSSGGTSRWIKKGMLPSICNADAM